MLTRSKSLKAKIDAAQFSLTKNSPLNFFQFKMWHIVKRFRWKFDTKKTFIIKIWYDDNFLITYLTRRKFFISKSDRF